MGSYLSEDTVSGFLNSSAIGLNRDPIEKYNYKEDSYGILTGSLR